MKVLKSLLVVSFFVLLPAFASAGLIDRAFPLLFRNTGNVLRPLQRVPGQPNYLLNNAAFNLQLAQHYGTQNGSGGSQDDLVLEEDEQELVPGAQPSFANPGANSILQGYDPYCPHQAEWPARVARGELPTGGGTVFSDMLMQRYDSERYVDIEDDIEEVEIKEEEEVQRPYAVTTNIAFERMRDSWVQRYLSGEVPPAPPGIMGEQVLDLVRAGPLDLEHEEGLPEVGSSLSADQMQDFAGIMAERNWTIEDISRILYETVERNTNYMIGAVNPPNAEGQPEELRVFTVLHEAMVKAFRRDTFDMQEYNAEIKALLDAVDALIKKE